MLTITTFQEAIEIIGYLALSSALILIIYSFYEFQMALNKKTLKLTKQQVNKEMVLLCTNCKNKNIISQSLPIAFGEFIQSFRCVDCETELYRKLVW
jgi:uncharacterized CHY-type Zn-finger protein